MSLEYSLYIWSILIKLNIMKNLTKHLTVENTCGKWYIVHSMNGALLEDFKTEREAVLHLNKHKAAVELVEQCISLVDSAGIIDRNIEYEGTYKAILGIDKILNNIIEQTKTNKI